MNINTTNSNAHASVEKSLTRQPSCRSLIDQLNHNCVIHDIAFSPKYGLIVTLLKLSTGALINVDFWGLKESTITLSTGVGTPRHAASPAVLLALRPTVRALVLDVLKTVNINDFDTKIHDEWTWQEEKLRKLLRDWMRWYRLDDGEGWYDNVLSACSESFVSSLDSWIKSFAIENSETKTGGKPPVDEDLILVIE